MRSARALAFPGWGHAAIGSVRPWGRLLLRSGGHAVHLRAHPRPPERDAERGSASRETVLLRELDREGVTDPTEIEARLDADPVLSELEVLVDSRESQQEDLIAFSLFLVLISAADAYVTAHLARFPDPLDVDAAPSPTGGVDLAVKVSLPN